MKLHLCNSAVPLTWKCCHSDTASRNSDLMSSSRWAWPDCQGQFPQWQPHGLMLEKLQQDLGPGQRLFSSELLFLCPLAPLDGDRQFGGMERTQQTWVFPLPQMEELKPGLVGRWRICDITCILRWWVKYKWLRMLGMDFRSVMAHSRWVTRRVW